jgi:hypothetical protein
MTIEAAPRRDWRDTLSLAADLALAGILVALLAVPVVTAGAAVATASAAIDHRLTRGFWPPLVELWALLRKAFLPGLGATLAGIVVGVLLVLDIAGLATGRVPGGPAVLALTALVALALVSLACVVVVLVGRRQARGWLASGRAAVRVAAAHPASLLAVLGTLLVPVLLTLMIPITAPIAFGFTLFALHVVLRRFV